MNSFFRDDYDKFWKKKKKISKDFERYNGLQSLVKVKSKICQRLGLMQLTWHTMGAFVTTVRFDTAVIFKTFITKLKYNLCSLSRLSNR